MQARSFGELLRRFRGAAELTQGALAERSGVGIETIRSLESGRRKSPRDETLRLLIDALGLAAGERARFTAAAGAERQFVPHELPADVQDFTGRADEVRRLVGLLASPGTVVITGRAGAGKTALAVHAARQVAFPNGEIFVNARMTSQPVRPVEGALLVLDDVQSAKQVPKATTGTVLVTSRQPLDEAVHIELGALPTADAERLLHQIVGADRWQQDPAATLEVIELCEGSPAALRRAAARMVGRPSWSPADLRGWLRTKRTAGGS
ncbi:helix-turn-helix domain-containing protein [Kribbella sp. NPDC005582]|uniref:helix-turn-helix domain-containing protein n=1 Tax=Kribbella sp. NPDC005582 TaxID=3156893 RepID=UPI0033A2BA36